MPGMDFVTIPDVELVGVGMKWDDRMTFRFDHLADAVAAQSDPHIQRPRITLGHTDPTFNPDAEEKHNPFHELGDGWPAIGSIDNMRLENDGAMIVGDLVEVPAWLGEVAASAYPTRSIEGAYLEGRWEVTTEGGKHYGFVLTAVALGGIWRPAISDLDDLRRYLTEGDGVVVAGAEPEGGQPVATVQPMPKPTATADIDKVIETFWTEFATAEEDRYWWWPRAAWTDPNELIVDDDEGGLYSVPFSSDADQNVTFGEPTRVLQTFVKAPEPATAQAVAVTAAGRHERPVATFEDRANAGRDEQKPEGSSASASVSGMDLTSLSAEQRTRLCTALELSADASDDDIEKALDETEPDPETPAGDGGDGGDGEGGDGGEGEGGDGGEDNPPAASAGMVQVPASEWQRVQENAAAGASLAADAEETRRDDTIAEATRDGKIAPASHQSMVNLHAENRDAFYKLLTAPVAEGGLQAGIVPTGERGSSADPLAAGSMDPAAFAAQMTQLFGPQFGGNA